MNKHHAYVLNPDTDKHYEIGRGFNTEEEAEEAAVNELDWRYSNQWEDNGNQFVFKDEFYSGFKVAAYTMTDEQIAEIARLQKEWDESKSERDKYGLYGRKGYFKIFNDARLLAGIATMEEIEADDAELWKRFVAAGGDDSHSGGSFYMVRARAYFMLKRLDKWRQLNNS